MVFSSLPALPQTEVGHVLCQLCMCVCVGVGGKINNMLDSERGRCSGTCTDLSLPHPPGHPSPSHSPHCRRLHLLQYVSVCTRSSSTVYVSV